MKKYLTIIFVLLIALVFQAPTLIRAAEISDQSAAEEATEDPEDEEMIGDEEMIEDEITEDKAADQERLSPQLVSCLKEKLGETTFAAIKAGEKEPGEEEKIKGEVCFQKYQIHKFVKPIQNPEQMDFAPETAACLEKNIGADYRQQMASISSHQAAESFHQKTKNCFGIGPKGGEAGNPEQMKQLKNCLVGAVGQAESDKMFSGNRPEPGSELFKKIESSGCFKNFNPGPPPGRGPREKLSPETEACIKGILGDDFTSTEPNEDKKKEIGEKCFKGRGPDDQMRGPQSLPAEVEACLKSKVGERFKDGPDALSESEKQSVGQCFKDNDFHPMGPDGQNDQNRQGPAMDMDPATKSCIEGIMGGNLVQGRPTDDQARKIGETCFKNQEMRRPPEGSDSRGQPPNNFQPGTAGSNYQPPERNDCIERIAGNLNPPFPDEISRRINQECFSGQSNTSEPSQNQIYQPPTNYNPPTNSTSPSGTYQQPPPEYNDAGGSYNQEGNTTETENRFFFSLPRFFRNLFR